jgi:hypothetical protein
MKTCQEQPHLRNPTGRSRQKADSLARLLRLKRLLNLSNWINAEHAPEGLEELNCEPEPAPNCVRCGYDLRGQEFGVCPECGLQLAYYYRDPTPWGGIEPDQASWLKTCISVLRWDRRTLVRVSLVPATPRSRRFARICLLVSAIMLAVSAVVSFTGKPSVYVLVANFMTSAVLSISVLWGILAGLGYCIRARWRKSWGIPGSLHYACAWWVAVSGVLLLLTVFFFATGESVILHFLFLAAVLGISLWALWLWASCGAWPHRVPSIPIACSALGLFLLPLFLLPEVPAVAKSVRTRAVNLVVRTKEAASASSPGLAMLWRPRSHALIIDAIGGTDDALTRLSIRKLGGGGCRVVSLLGAECTMDSIEGQFYSLPERVGGRDKLILYINGHGPREGSGAIQMADGYITSQWLAGVLKSLPTPNKLVIIDSCFGGKFLEAFDQDIDAVALTATDNRNIAWGSGVVPLWTALRNPTSDELGNADGQVSINEAFFYAYRTMLKRGEAARQTRIAFEDNPEIREELVTAGAMSPQLRVFGDADPTVFAVEIAGGQTSSGNSP